MPEDVLRVLNTAPLVRLVAAVADGIVSAPIGVGVTACQIIAPRRTIQATVTIIRIPRSIVGIATVPTARAPAEEVAVNVLAAAVLARGGAENIPLVVGKLPIRRAGTANVLQVALREVHALAGTHGEHAVYRTRWGLRLLREVRHQSTVAGHCEGIVGVGRNLATVFRPVGEGVARIGHGMHRTGLIVVMHAAAAHRAAIARAGRNINVIGVLVEMRHV